MSFLGFSALFSTMTALAGPLPSELKGIEGAAAAWDAQPRATRGQVLRFTDPSLQDHPELVPVLLARLEQGEESAPVRAALVELLPRTGGDWSGPVVALYEEEADPSVRMVMVEVARRADPADARALVEKGAADADPAVRAAAMRAIPRLEGADLSALVVAGLRDRDPEVRAFAARAAGWMALPGAFEPTAALLKDADAEVRLQALHALERMDAGRAAGLAQVAALRADADPKVARAAAEVAGR